MIQHGYCVFLWLADISQAGRQKLIVSTKLQDDDTIQPCLLESRILKTTILVRTGRMMVTLDIVNIKNNCKVTIPYEIRTQVSFTVIFSQYILFKKGKEEAHERPGTTT